VSPTDLSAPDPIDAAVSARNRSSPLTVFLAQMGEDVPADDGYVPLRYGRLAEDLTARGDKVVRVTPSFSHFRKTTRPTGVGWSDTEGEHVVVGTGTYSSSFDPRRVRFFGQYVTAVARELRARRHEVDVAVLAIPPPSIITACRAAVGRSVPIVADVRDLWPEALVVGRGERFMPAAEIGGSLISQELRLASAITAVTQPMLDWTPDPGVPRRLIPIGLQTRVLDQSRLPAANDPLKACFLSNHAHGYDFVPVLEGWTRYVGSLPAELQARAELAFIGVEPATEREREMVAADPTVRFLGRVKPEDLTGLLSGFDVGLAPALPEWETSVGNKVFDYLSAGLLMIHSITPTDTAAMDAEGLSRRCPLTIEGWTEAFAAITPPVLADLRAGRKERIDLADRLVGRQATTGVFVDLIDRVAAQHQTQHQTGHQSGQD
jgi:hypothetical protein